MESRVTSIDAPGRVESGRGVPRLGPDSGSASGRTAVTKADEGVAPPFRGATQIVTHSSAGVGLADLAHEDVRGQLSDYFDDAVDESTRRRIDTHLASCSPCTAYANTLRATIATLSALPAPKAPTGARARILERARREGEPARADG